MTVPSLVNSGVYKVISVATGTVMTLAQSGHVLSEHDRNKKSQLWQAEFLGGEKWKLRNEGGNGNQYLDYTEGNIVTGKPLVGGPGGFEFDITQWHTRGGAEYRIWFPNTPLPGFVTDVNGGSNKEGTPIQVWASNDSAVQFWLFQRILV